MLAILYVLNVLSEEKQTHVSIKTTSVAKLLITLVESHQYSQLPSHVMLSMINVIVSW